MQISQQQKSEARCLAEKKRDEERFLSTPTIPNEKKNRNIIVPKNHLFSLKYFPVEAFVLEKNLFLLSTYLLKSEIIDPFAIPIHIWYQ